ncbi:hypothetical protein N8561_01280 [bacterium]|nr:hypothetical protein [bacterium]
MSPPRSIWSRLSLAISGRAANITSSISIFFVIAILSLGTNHSLALEIPAVSESSQIALNYIGLGKPQEAVKIMNTMIKLNPKDSDSYYIRGLAKLGQSQLVSAIEDFNKSILLTSSHYIRYQSFLNRAMALGAIGDYKNCVSDWEEVIRLDPTNSQNNNGKAYWFVDSTYNLLGEIDVDRSCDLLKKAKELGYTKEFTDEILNKFC